jgi:hypothetical protein
MRRKYVSYLFLCITKPLVTRYNLLPVNYRIDMKKTFIAITAIFGINLLSVFNSVAAPAKFYGTDYSGVYACKGSNAKVGDYELTVTFSLNKANSSGNIGNYDLSVQTENPTAYTGQAIVKGNDMALTIKFVDGNKHTYSTGLAKFKRIYIEERRFSYMSEYYESDTGANANANSDKPGNFGSEECIQKPSNPAAS